MTTIRIVSGERSTRFLVTSATIAWLVFSRSSRLMPGRAGAAGGDDADRRPGGLVVAVRADHVRLVADHGPGLVEVERLALRQALDDVDQHDVGVVALGQPLGGGGADVAGADDGDLGDASCPNPHAAR